MSPLTATTFARLLERATGQQLTPARRWRIETLLKPLLRSHGLGTLDHLAAALRAPQPARTCLENEVVEALLNHETSFFRDAPAFALLEQEVLPALAAARARERRLRIWSAGCATGQETYSLALLLARGQAGWRGWTIDLVGTDVSAAAVAQARAGRYGRLEIERGLPPEDRRTWFVSASDGWEVRPALRRGVTFHQHNLLDAAPGSFELVLCRNVLLYFPFERQGAVLRRLAAAIAPGGYLMLGAGETLGGRTEAFAPIHHGLYRRLEEQGAR